METTIEPISENPKCYSYEFWKPGEQRDHAERRVSRVRDRDRCLRSLGFRPGRDDRYDFDLHLDDTSALRVDLDYGTWETAKADNKQDRIFALSYSEWVRKHARAYYGEEVLQQPAAAAAVRWLVAGFCEPMGLMVYVPEALKTIYAEDADILLHSDNATLRQWMLLNLWRVE